MHFQFYLVDFLDSKFSRKLIINNNNNKRDAFSAQTRRSLCPLQNSKKKYREQKHEYPTLQTYSTVLISTKINYDMG